MISDYKLLIINGISLDVYDIGSNVINFKEEKIFFETPTRDMNGKIMFGEQFTNISLNVLKNEFPITEFTEKDLEIINSYNLKIENKD